jgi:hypothetical protein
MACLDSVRAFQDFMRACSGLMKGVLVLVLVKTFYMSSYELVDMFEVDFTVMCTEEFPLMSMGG